MAQALKTSMASWEIFETGGELDDAAGRLFFQIGREAIRERGHYRVLLSGGKTPEGLYRKIGNSGNQGLAWERSELFLGDERPVPGDHPESNAGMVRRCLLEPLQEASPRFYPVAGVETDPSRAAFLYEKEMEKVFQTGTGSIPRFDLVFLGVGEDGHTASLFPGSPALHESGRRVVADHIEKTGSYRVTATLSLINQAREVVILVKDKKKAPVMEALFAGTADPKWPISRVAPVSGNLRFLLTREAAGGIPLGK